MSESALGRIKSDVLDGPAGERLKEELRLYLTSRFEAAGRGALLKGLERGRRALGEGKTPLRAALTVGAHAAKDSVKKKAVGVVGGGRGRNGGSAKRVTVVEDLDVGVPLEVAYDEWAAFEDFGIVARNVVDTEEIQDRRIAWTAEGARGTVHGVVTFHRLADDLTRILLVLEYAPRGLRGRLRTACRVPGRLARLDLERYRTYLMLRDDDVDDEEYEDEDQEDLYEDEAVEGEDVAYDDAAYEDEEEDDEEFYDEDSDEVDR
ncbi:SRPBCC family protein [Streptomyces sp. NPDC003327]